MGKETFYFSHDYNPTGDPKIAAMLSEHGACGYGVYWRIVEMLHAEPSHVLPLKKYIFLAIAKQMLANVEQIDLLINSCINDYELFITDGTNFWSDRVKRNLSERASISEKRALAGKKGAIAKQNLANAKQQKANASKGKERKGNNNKSYSETDVSDGIYPKCMDLYDGFILEKTGVGAKIDSATGAALNKIIAYLKTQCKNKENLPEAVPESFHLILSNYEHWDTFHQGQLNLNQIESNLINIMNSIRNSKIKQNAVPAKETYTEPVRRKS